MDLISSLRYAAKAKKEAEAKAAEEAAAKAPPQGGAAAPDERVEGDEPPPAPEAKPR